MSRKSPTSSVLAGIGLLLLFHVGMVILSSIVFVLALAISLETFAGLLVFAVLGIGLSQVLYVVPLCIYLSRKRQFNKMKGVIIGAVVTALLTGGCYLLFWAAMTSPY